MDYAIIESGGKQYRVQRGDTVRVETVPGDEGDAVEFDNVLLVSQNGNLSLGTPSVPGARVTTEVVRKGRAKKVIVFKYKAKRATDERMGTANLIRILK